MKNQDKEYYLAQWIEGLISDSELKELVSEEEFSALSKMREKLDVYAALEQPLDKTFSEITTKIKSNKAPKRSNRKLILAVAAVAIICLSLVTILNPKSQTYETGFGEQRLFALADGSEVILNAKSSLTYNESDFEADRTLYLEGEAYFKVSKGSTFTVNTSRGSVEVLGTEFNVNTTDELFEVVCYEGSVKVSQFNEQKILLPNDNIRKVNGNAIETWTSSISSPNWVKGESTFRSMPLKYVIFELEEQYNITFNTEYIDTTILFSGSFTHNNLETALQTVFAALEITYNEKEKDVITLTSN